MSMAPSGVFRHPAPSPQSLYKGRLPWTHRGLTLLDHIVSCLPTPYDKEYMCIRDRNSDIQPQIQHLFIHLI